MVNLLRYEIIGANCKCNEKKSFVQLIITIIIITMKTYQVPHLKKKKKSPKCTTMATYHVK